MGTYSGRLWLVHDRLSDVRVTVHLDDETIKIFSNGTVIGDWSLSDVEVRQVEGDVHLVVEGEELVVSSTDPGFAPALVKPVEAAEGDSSLRRRPSTYRGAHRARGRLKLRW
jgi:hypothetical protein